MGKQDNSKWLMILVVIIGIAIGVHCFANMMTVKAEELDIEEITDDIEVDADALSELESVSNSSDIALTSGFYPYVVDDTDSTDYTELLEDIRKCITDYSEAEKAIIDDDYEVLYGFTYNSMGNLNGLYCVRLGYLERDFWVGFTAKSLVINAKNSSVTSFADETEAKAYFLTAFPNCVPVDDTNTYLYDPSRKRIYSYYSYSNNIVRYAYASYYAMFDSDETVDISDKLDSGYYVPYGDYYNTIYYKLCEVVTALNNTSSSSSDVDVLNRLDLIGEALRGDYYTRLDELENPVVQNEVRLLGDSNSSTTYTIYTVPDYSTWTSSAIVVNKSDYDYVYYNGMYYPLSSYDQLRFLYGSKYQVYGYADGSRLFSVSSSSGYPDFSSYITGSATSPNEGGVIEEEEEEVEEDATLVSGLQQFATLMSYYILFMVLNSVLQIAHYIRDCFMVKIGGMKKQK